MDAHQPFIESHVEKINKGFAFMEKHHLKPEGLNFFKNKLNK